MADPTGAFCALHPQRSAVATCDHCGTFACPECVTLHRGAQICRTCIDTGRVRPASTPWEQRGELGLLAAWWQTVLAVSAAPGRFFETLDVKRGVGESVGFAALSLVPATLMGFVFQTVLLALFGDALYDLVSGALGDFATRTELPPGTLEEIEKAFSVTPGSMLSGLFSSVGVGIPFYLFIVALFAVVQHVLLVLTGAGKEGLEATLQTAFYATGVRFWEVIPLVSIFSTVWVIAVEGIGFGAVHKAGWKGHFAAWGPMLGCCGCLFAGSLILGVMGAALGS